MIGSLRSSSASKQSAKTAMKALDASQMPSLLMNISSPGLPISPNGIYIIPIVVNNVGQSDATLIYTEVSEKFTNERLNLVDDFSKVDVNNQLDFEIPRGSSFSLTPHLKWNQIINTEYFYVLVKAKYEDIFKHKYQRETCFRFKKFTLTSNYTTTSTYNADGLCFNHNNTKPIND